MTDAHCGRIDRTFAPVASLGSGIVLEEHKLMAVALPNPVYAPMAAAIHRARKLLHMKQEELSEILKVSRQWVGQVEQMRRYPSRRVLNQFAELFDVNLDVYVWARDPVNADSLPGLLGMVPLHIVRLYERRLIDAAVHSGRSRRLERKSSRLERQSFFDDLPSIFTAK
jgi:transcriptional regulator with XRE-family HTH domain